MGNGRSVLLAIAAGLLATALCRAATDHATTTAKPGTQHATDAKTVTWLDPDSYEGYFPYSEVADAFPADDAATLAPRIARNGELAAEGLSLLDRLVPPQGTAQLLKLFTKYWYGKAANDADAKEMIDKLIREKGENPALSQQFWQRLAALLRADRARFLAQSARAVRILDSDHGDLTTDSAKLADLAKAHQATTAAVLKRKKDPIARKRAEAIAGVAEKLVRAELEKANGPVDWTNPCSVLERAALAFAQNDFAHPQHAYACAKEKWLRLLQSTLDSVKAEANQVRHSAMKSSLAYQTAFPSPDDATKVNPPIPSARKQTDAAYQKALQAYQEIQLHNELKGIKGKLTQAQAKRIARKLGIDEKDAQTTVPAFLQLSQGKDSPRLEAYRRNSYFQALTAYYHAAGLDPEAYPVPSAYKEATLKWCLGLAQNECSSLADRLQTTLDKFAACQYQNSPVAQDYPPKTDRLGVSDKEACKTRGDYLQDWRKLINAANEAEGQAHEDEEKGKTGKAYSARRRAEALRRKAAGLQNGLYDPIGQGNPALRRDWAGQGRTDRQKDLKKIDSPAHLKQIADSLRSQAAGAPKGSAKRKALKEAQQDAESALKDLPSGEKYRRLIAFLKDAEKKRDQMLMANAKEGKSDQDFYQRMEPIAKRLRAMGFDQAQIERAFDYPHTITDLILTHLPRKDVEQLAALGFEPERTQDALKYPRALYQALHDPQFRDVRLLGAAVKALPDDKLKEMWAAQEERERLLHQSEVLLGVLEFMPKGKDDPKAPIAKIREEMDHAFDKAIAMLNKKDKMTFSSDEEKRKYYQKYFKPILTRTDKGDLAVRVVPTEALQELQTAQAVAFETHHHTGDDFTGIQRNAPFRAPQTNAEVIGWWQHFKDGEPKLNPSTQAGGAVTDMMVPKIIAAIFLAPIAGPEVVGEVTMTYMGVQVLKQGAMWMEGRRDFRHNERDRERALEDIADAGLDGMIAAPLLVAMPKTSTGLGLYFSGRELKEDIDEKHYAEAAVDLIPLGLSAHSAYHQTSLAGKKLYYVYQGGKVAFYSKAPPLGSFSAGGEVSISETGKMTFNGKGPKLRGLLNGERLAILEEAASDAEGMMSVGHAHAEEKPGEWHFDPGKSKDQEKKEAEGDENE